MIFSSLLLLFILLSIFGMIKCDYVNQMVVRACRWIQCNQEDSQNHASAAFTRRRSLENDLALVVSSGSGLTENQSWMMESPSPWRIGKSCEENELAVFNFDLL